MARQDPFFDDWEADSSEENALFGETQWTVFDGLEGTEQQRAAALESLCRRYRQPLVCYARARGLRDCDAEDAVQGFFLHFLRRDGFSAVKRREGRLREFLMGSFENYRIDLWRRAQAVKRGGGAQAVPLTEEHEPVDGETPEQIYDREWGRALAAAALERVQREVYRRPGGAVVWQALGALVAEPAAGKGECKRAAKEMGIRMSTARMRLERLRRRYELALFVEAALTLRCVHYPSVMEELRAVQVAP